MTPQQRIDRIANGLWLSKTLRGESVAQLEKRLKHMMVLIVVLCVPFIVCLFLDFEAILGHKAPAFYVMAALMPLPVVFCALLTRRVINLREVIEGAAS